MLTRQSQHAKFKYGWNLVLFFLLWSILKKKKKKGNPKNVWKSRNGSKFLRMSMLVIYLIGQLTPRNVSLCIYAAHCLVRARWKSQWDSPGKIKMKNVNIMWKKTKQNILYNHKVQLIRADEEGSQQATSPLWKYQKFNSVITILYASVKRGKTKQTKMTSSRQKKHKKGKWQVICTCFLSPL